MNGLGDNHRHGLNGLLSYYLVVFKRKITIYSNKVLNIIAIGLLFIYI